MEVEPKPWPKWAVVCCFGTMLTIPLLGIALMICLHQLNALDARLTEAVRSFTLSNSIGDRPTAMSRIVPGQSKEYMRWVGLNHEFRPPSADLVDIQLLERTPTITWVELHLSLADPGDVSSQIQAWRKNTDGSWWFDAQATLERATK